MSYSQGKPRPRRNKKADIEHQLQVGCVAWASMQGMIWPELDTLYAIPNQAKRGKFGYVRMNSEGLKKGMPDLHLPIARRGWSSLYIEMKPPGGKPRAEQIKKMKLLQEWGNLCYTITNHYDFIEVMTWYLGHEDPARPDTRPSADEKFLMVGDYSIFEL